MRGWLSADLYSLSQPANRAIKPMDAQAQQRANAFYEAKQNKNWDAALALLRQVEDYIAPAIVAQQRGSVWAGAKHFEIAVEFYRRAAQLEPKSNLPAMYVHALAKVDLTAAIAVAEEIVQNATNYHPNVVVQAAQVLSAPSKKKSAEENQKLALRLIEVVAPIARQMEASGVDNNPGYRLAAVLLGNLYAHVGNTGPAYEYLSRALRLNPTDAGLLTMRGILMYGIQAEAVKDFELAVQYQVDNVWPYYFLAHNYLTTGRYDACRKACERGLDLAKSIGMKSELTEWLAICGVSARFPGADGSGESSKRRFG